MATSARNNQSEKKPKLKFNEQQVVKLLAVMARENHPKAVEWGQRIFFYQGFGEKHRYVTPQEASKIISGSMQ